MWYAKNTKSIVMLTITVLCSQVSACMAGKVSFVTLPNKARILLFDDIERNNYRIHYGIASGFNGGFEHAYCIAFHMLDIIRSLYRRKVEIRYADDTHMMYKLDKCMTEYTAYHKASQYIFTHKDPRICKIALEIFIDLISSFAAEFDENIAHSMVSEYKRRMPYCLHRRMSLLDKFSQLGQNRFLKTDLLKCRCLLNKGTGALKENLLSFWRKNYIAAKTLIGVTSASSIADKAELCQLAGNIVAGDNKPHMSIVEVHNTPSNNSVYEEAGGNIKTVNLPNADTAYREQNMQVIIMKLKNSRPQLQIHIALRPDLPYFKLATEFDFNALCSLVQNYTLHDKLSKLGLVSRIQMQSASLHSGFSFVVTLFLTRNGMTRYNSVLHEFYSYIASIDFNTLLEHRVANYNNDIHKYSSFTYLYRYCLHALEYGMNSLICPFTNATNCMFFDRDLYNKVFRSIGDRSQWTVFYVTEQLFRHSEIYSHPTFDYKYQIEDIEKIPVYNNNSGLYTENLVSPGQKYSQAITGYYADLVEISPTDYRHMKSDMPNCYPNSVVAHVPLPSYPMYMNPLTILQQPPTQPITLIYPLGYNWQIYGNSL